MEYYNTSNTPPVEWTRKEGWIAGVCEGMADTIGVSPNLLRLLWIVSFFAFGAGFLIYLVLALTLPHQDRLHQAHQERVMGVCHRIHLKTGFDLGLIRFFTVMLALGSFGTVTLVYLLLWFVMPEPSEQF